MLSLERCESVQNVSKRVDLEKCRKIRHFSLPEASVQLRTNPARSLSKPRTHRSLPGPPARALTGASRAQSGGLATTHHSFLSSFSAVSTATIARNGAFFHIFRDLQDFHIFAPLRIQNFKKIHHFCQNLANFPKFCKFC